MCVAKLEFAYKVNDKALINCRYLPCYPLSSSTGIQCIISHTVVSWPASVSASTWNPIPFRTPLSTLSPLVTGWYLSVLPIYPVTTLSSRQLVFSWQPDRMKRWWSVGISSRMQALEIRILSSSGRATRPVATTAGQPGLAMTNIPSSINSFKPHASLGSAEDEKNEIYAEYCFTLFSSSIHKYTTWVLSSGPKCQCPVHHKNVPAREVLYINHGPATGEQ